MVAKGDLLGFWPVLGRGHLFEIRARVRNGKPRFPRARGTLGGEIRPPQKFLLKIAHFFYILRFGRPDPQGGKPHNTGFLGPFVLGQPLALGEIPVGKTEKHNSPIETEKRETKPLQLGPNTQS